MAKVSQDLDSMLEIAMKPERNDETFVNENPPPKPIIITIPQYAEDGLRDNESESVEEYILPSDKPGCFIQMLYSLALILPLGIFTLSLAATTAYMNLERPQSEWAAIPIWRWTLYLSLFLPVWAFAGIINAMMAHIAGLRASCCYKADEDGTKRFSPMKIFLQQYAFAVKIFIWSILVTILFALCFISTYGSTGFASPPLDQWQNFYFTLLRLHIVFVLFTAGQAAVQYLDFKYLDKYSSKPLLEKIDNSIFQEIIIAGLAGYKAYHMTSFLPVEMYSGPDKVRQRREQVASKYVRETSLSRMFSTKMRLGTERRAVVVSAVVKRISQTINADKQEPELLQDEAYKRSADTGSRRHAKLRRETVEATLQQNCPHLNLEKAWKFLEPSGTTGFLSMQELKEIVFNVFDDRRSVIMSLEDTESITAQIKTWIQVLVNIAVLLIAVLVMGTNGVDVWVGFTSFIIGFSFIFGGAIKTAFDNFIFLYGSHPFEIGDSILVGETRYTVERVLLQTTKLSHFGQIRIMQNSALRLAEPLVNLTSSKEHWLKCDYIVDTSVLTEGFLRSLNGSMEAFFKDQEETYKATFRIDHFEFLPPLKVKLTLLFGLPFSPSQLRRARIAHSQAARHFAETLLYLGVKYTAVVEYSPEGIPVAH